MLWIMLKILLIVGVLALSCAGVWALVSPHTFVKLNRSSGHNIKLQCIDSELPNKTHFVDGVIYRFHYVMGLAMMLVSAIALYIGLFVLDQNMLLQGDSSNASTFLNQLLISVAIMLTHVAGLAGLSIGMIVFIRPSALKTVEMWGNRWVSCNRLFSYAERNIMFFDRWVERHTRLYGLTVLCMASLITVIASWAWLSGH